MENPNQNSTEDLNLEHRFNDTPEEPKGPTIGIVIIIIILILGGVYVFMSRNDNTIPEDGTTSEDLAEQSTSTELSDIESDALNTDLSDIERELDDIQAEIDAEQNTN